MNKYIKAVAAIMLIIASATPAAARPQLHTPSIGWISPNDIICADTSDHTCIVRKDIGFAYTSTKWQPYEYSGTPDPEAKPLYRVNGGTVLIVLDYRGSQLSDPAYDAKGDVEVAIVIPAEWGKDNELQPIRKCGLKTRGKFPPIVSLSCGGR